MYKLDLPIDMKETAATERRRNREMQRQSRIFNARVRTIGVSVLVVKSQQRFWLLPQFSSKIKAYVVIRYFPNFRSICKL